MSFFDRRTFFTGAASTCACVLGCRTSALSSPEKHFAFTPTNRLRVAWPNLQTPMRLWVVGDTHFGLIDARDKAFTENCARMATWAAKKETFEAMLAKARKEKPDILVLVGDNLSFPTCANVEYLETTLKACGVPWIYVAGNHDWHFEGDAGSDIEQRAHWTDARLKPLYQGANPLMTSRVVKGVRIVMIDNSIYHILPEQLEFYRSEADKGDPLCLCLHIPLWVPTLGLFTCGCPTWGAATDPYWKIERRERWSERQSPATFAFREAVLSTPNLIGVFSGHLHELQIARQSGQNLFTVPTNQSGAYLDVSIGT